MGSSMDYFQFWPLNLPEGPVPGGELGLGLRAELLDDPAVLVQHALHLTAADIHEAAPLQILLNTGPRRGVLGWRSFTLTIPVTGTSYYEAQLLDGLCLIDKILFF